MFTNHKLFLFVVLFVFFDQSFAAIPPPYIAFQMAENLSFDEATCVRVSKQTLTQNGFQRVTPEGNTLLAAYSKTKDYQFKVLVTCLPAHGVIHVVVVTTLSGKGIDKATTVLQNIVHNLNKKTPQNPVPASGKESESDYQYSLSGTRYKGSDKSTVTYRRAAEQGNADAQYQLGKIFYEGYNVPQDFLESYVWLLLAASQGNRDAAKMRDKVIVQLSQPQIAEGQRLAQEIFKQYSSKSK